MQLIVDANILIAAFLKSATTRELLFDEELELFAPEYFALEVSRTIKEDKSSARRASFRAENRTRKLSPKAIFLKKDLTIPKIHVKWNYVFQID